MRGSGAVLTAGALALPSAASACRLALLLALDVSSSVDSREYALQKNGLAAALIAPEVVEAFLSSPAPVALAAYEWSGQRDQQVVLDWRLIDGAAALTAAAETIAGAERSASQSPTALGSALGFGAGMLAGAPGCAQSTIDVSGDGLNNDGFPPQLAYNQFRFGDATVNALIVTGHEDATTLTRYFTNQVIRGPGAFVERADGYEDFERAMRKKLEREVRALAVGRLSE